MTTIPHIDRDRYLAGWRANPDQPAPRRLKQATHEQLRETADMMVLKRKKLIMSEAERFRLKYDCFIEAAENMGYPHLRDGRYPTHLHNAAHNYACYGIYYS